MKVTIKLNPLAFFTIEPIATKDMNFWNIWIIASQLFPDNQSIIKILISPAKLSAMME